MASSSSVSSSSPTNGQQQQPLGSVSSSVAAALSEGLERLVEMSDAAGPSLSRESLPLLESFLHATDLLVESAEAVGATTKERTLRDAIFNYGRELKAEASALREVAQGLAQTPAMGQTAETKKAMIRALIKIGKLTANLMHAEEDADQKVLSHACKNCATSAKTLVTKTRRTHSEMIEAARVFAQNCVELVKALSDIAYRYAETSPKHRDELLHVANQIKTTSPKLIEAVKVAHFNPGDTTNMEAALVVVRALAGEISRAITLAKGPAFTVELRLPSPPATMPPALSSSPPLTILSSSPSSSSSFAPPSPSLASSSSGASSPSTSRAGGGGLGGAWRRPEGSGSGIGGGSNTSLTSSTEGTNKRKKTITDSTQGMDVLLRARAMSRAVTLRLKIGRQLDLRALDEHAEASADVVTSSTVTTTGCCTEEEEEEQKDDARDGQDKREGFDDEEDVAGAPTSTATSGRRISGNVGKDSGQLPHHSASSGKSGGNRKGSIDKEESRLLLRITKLEVDNKKLRDENDELRRRFEKHEEETQWRREQEEAAEQLKRKVVSMADENSRLRQEVEKLNDKLRLVTTHLQKLRDLALVDVLQDNNNRLLQQQPHHL